MPVKKAPAKKAASKRDSNKKIADSDEDDYVPEKEEPDEALDVKLEEEADDVDPAGDQEDEVDEVVPMKKRGKRAKASKPGKKEPKRSGRTIVRVDPVTLEHKRVLDTHVESGVGDPEFERQLVEFLETGNCPKCHSTLKRAHERHLKLCVFIRDALDVPCLLAACVSNSIRILYPIQLPGSHGRHDQAKQ